MTKKKGFFMKTHWVLGMLLVGSIAVGAAADSSMEKGASPVRQATAKDMGQPAKADIAVTVNGMVCPFCAQGITKKFKAMPEVQSVDVRMSESRVYVTLRKGEELDDKSVQEVLTKSGYNVEKIERVPR
jgi:copper chaperone CopZ